MKIDRESGLAMSAVCLAVIIAVAQPSAWLAALALLVIGWQALVAVARTVYPRKEEAQWTSIFSPMQTLER